MQTKQLKLNPAPIEIPRIHIPLEEFSMRKNLRRGRKYIFIARSYYAAHPEIKKYVLRGFFGLLALDAILLGFFLLRTVSPLTQAERASASSFIQESSSVKTVSPALENSLGAGTQAFITSLKERNIAATPVGTTKLIGLSAPGTVVTIGEDSVSVFEYASAEAATREATALASTYTAKSKPGLWDKSVHIYVKDTLVLFYLGTNENTQTALGGLAGDSLIDGNEMVSS